MEAEPAMTDHDEQAAALHKALDCDSANHSLVKDLLRPEKNYQRRIAIMATALRAATEKVNALRCIQIEELVKENKHLLSEIARARGQGKVEVLEEVLVKLDSLVPPTDAAKTIAELEEIIYSPDEKVEILPSGKIMTGVTAEFRQWLRAQVATLKEG